MLYNKRTYAWCLAAVAALSAYPLFFGVRIAVLALVNGGIEPWQYARYVIPYTAVSASVLIAAAAAPLLLRLGRWAAGAAALCGLALFFPLEYAMEQLTVRGAAFQNAVLMQLASCIATPAARSALLLSLSGYLDGAFRIHYYLVSLLLIAMALGTVYGFLRPRADARGRAAQTARLVCTAVFLGFCVFANFTGFFRTSTDLLSPLSAGLTALFFVVMAASTGVFAGSALPARLARAAPCCSAAAALAVCLVMYYGEYRMLGGRLYQLGVGAFFIPTSLMSLSPADLALLTVSAAAGALACLFVSRKA